MPQYHVNQFLIDSDIELTCPPLNGTPAAFATVPLQVKYYPGLLWESFAWIHPTARMDDGNLWSFDTEEGALISVQDKVRMLVHRNGQRIIIDSKGPYYQTMSDCVLGFGMGLCTLLQGGVPLHGACVAPPNNCGRIALLAPSGTGKSTLLWALLQSGWLLGNDDLVPVCNSDGRYEAYSSGDMPVKITETVAKLLGVDIGVGNPGAKVAVTIPRTRRASRTAPLDLIVVLKPTNPDTSSECRMGQDDLAIPFRWAQFRGAEAVLRLHENSWALWAIGGVIEPPTILRRYMNLVRETPVYCLSYPKRYDILPMLETALRTALAEQRGECLKSGWNV